MVNFIDFQTVLDQLSPEERLETELLADKIRRDFQSTSQNMQTEVQALQTEISVLRNDMKQGFAEVNQALDNILDNKSSNITVAIWSKNSNIQE